MNRNRKEKGGCFTTKTRMIRKKRILAGAVAVIIVLAMIASMVVSAFAEETQGQVQAKSYDLTFNQKNNRRVWTRRQLRGNQS